MIVAVPAAVPVKVTEHVPAAKVQLAALKVPADPVDVNATVPVGVLVVPAAVSVTVVVQVVATLIATVAGMHETAVEVVRRLTTTLAVPLLPPCVESPLYVPVIVSVLAVVPPGV